MKVVIEIESVVNDAKSEQQRNRSRGQRKPLRSKQSFDPCEESLRRIGLDGQVCHDAAILTFGFAVRDARATASPFWGDVLRLMPTAIPISSARAIQKLIRRENVSIATVCCHQALAFSSDIPAVVDILPDKLDAGLNR